MQDKKVKSTKGSVIFASILIAVSMIGELYGLLNVSYGILMYVLLAGCAVILIISLSMFVNGIYKEQNLKNVQMQEYMDNVLKSEKASYLMMRKNFEQMENQLKGFQNSSDVPVEDIINAQKGVAKVIINRNKENADAILSSILFIHNDFVRRISHPEPGMSSRQYYKDLINHFNKEVSGIIDQICAL